MALFGRNKKEEQKEGAPTTQPVRTTSVSRDIAHVLTHARITEKASHVQGGSVYAFDVAPRATKRDIIAAVRSIYKVTPRKVAVVTIPAKTRRAARTGIRGVQGGGKKAYVYLKQGDTITL